MNRSLGRAAHFFAPIALCLTSCGDSSHLGIPTFQAPRTYGRPVDPDTAFRDDAPANRQLTAANLALHFVDHEGKPVDLAAYRGKKSVVLVVTRGLPQSPGGVFCPHCVAQVSSLTQHHPEFEKRNAAILVVFPGPSEQINAFIQQARSQSLRAGPQGLPFPLLLDKDISVCTQLGIRADLARPSTFIVDRQGNVVYAFVGDTSTDRPSVKALLGQLDRLGDRP
jgi:peroxiredoxin